MFVKRLHLANGCIFSFYSQYGTNLIQQRWNTVAPRPLSG